MIGQFHLDVRSDKLEDLRAAMVIALSHTQCSAVLAFRKTTVPSIPGFCEKSVGVEAVVLLWAEHDEAKSFPYPMGINGAVEMMQRIIESAEYPPEPQIDGHCNRGLRIFSEVSRGTFDLVGIQPHWIMYHK